MYTNLKSYQIIIALLKAYNIKHLVLSAGSRNVPFVHSVEEDSFFTCYSVVDERSAAYFALGLSQQLQEPVVISCTASTASSNYWPAIGEAFYQGVPLIILTSDRNPSMLHQWEDQMIDQVGMFDRHVKCSVNLPIINDEDDWLYCQRLVNKAFLSLNHHGTGPVHINIPMKDYCLDFDTPTLPNVTKIQRIERNEENKWELAYKKLKGSKRILITCGQSPIFNNILNNALSTFYHKFNCAISTEHMSNINCEGAIHTSVCMDVRYNQISFAEFIPDIVISFGYNISQGIKEQLRWFHGKYEHWSIQPDGEIVDMYNSLTKVFECEASDFFEKMNTMADDTQKNNQEYYQKLSDYANNVHYPDFDWSSTYAVQQLIQRMPCNSILHMAINNSIRICNFFKLKENIRSYANIGTYGIDGCLSSLLGQAIATNELSFLIIGDLAFFYDMNALRIKHIKNNVRILMLNNQGGSEFYYNGSWKDESSDLHTTARHHTKAEGWVKENKFIYLSAHDKNSFEEALKIFLNKESEKSIFLEIFSEMKNDSDIIHNFYNMNRQFTPTTVKQKIKNTIKTILPEPIIKIIKQ